MSTQWWDETTAEFAANFALASTGMHGRPAPEVRIEHIEGGVYTLSIDKQSLALTAQDLRDVFDWILRHMREIEQQAKEQAS